MRPSKKLPGAGEFSTLLLDWYDQTKRKLPWREDGDPYRVWLSEVMLQQTRVAAVIDHYQRFLRRFPTVQKLAAAREASVLAMWSGLGYYRRARMLHAAAKKIVKENDGHFPETSEALRDLPGIGRYTSAAIASIAFDEPIAVVDGNVERVLRRVSGRDLSDEECWQAAEILLERQRPGDFNQAMMELGATVCLPRGPVCLACPVLSLCATRGEEDRKARTPRQKKREVHYTLDFRDDSVFLVQRPNNASLMPGMWELPEANDDGVRETWLTFKHSITVTDYTVRVVRDVVPSGVNGRRMPKKRLAALPLTGLARKVLRAAQVI